jgi:hypothetical protein
MSVSRVAVLCFCFRKRLLALASTIKAGPVLTFAISTKSCKSFTINQIQFLLGFNTSCVVPLAVLTFLHQSAQSGQVVDFEALTAYNVFTPVSCISLQSKIGEMVR